MGGKGGEEGSVWIPRSLFARLGSDPAKCTPQLSLSRQIIPGGGSAERRGGGGAGEEERNPRSVASLHDSLRRRQSTSHFQPLPLPSRPTTTTPRPGFKPYAEKKTQLSPPQRSIPAGGRHPPGPGRAPRRPRPRSPPAPAPGRSVPTLCPPRLRRRFARSAAAAAVARATRAWQSRALKVISSELLFPLMIYA